MSAKPILTVFFFMSLLTVLPPMSNAELRTGLLFGDGMVLQRDVPVRVWGSATPGVAVELKFAGQSVAGQTDSAGKWIVELEASSAGGPFEMVVSADGEELTIRNVLVGDVWVCSGQSNMEWSVASSMNAAAEIALADDRKIRHFKVPRSWAPEPRQQLAGGAWTVADPTSRPTSSRRGTSTTTSDRPTRETAAVRRVSARTAGEPRWGANTRSAA